ncbi:MAG: hypothetical protein AAGI01_16595, partial [Myxococcota bacterium]
TTSQSVTVTFTPPDLPVVDTFTTDKQVVVVGESATLSWTTTNADTVTLADELNNVIFTSANMGEVASGSTVVSPTATTTYSLIASDELAGASAPSQVEVAVVQPLEAMLTASPDEITQGDQVTLTWSGSGGAEGGLTSVEIVDDRGEMVDLGASPEPAGGSVVLSPTQDTTYTVTISDGALMGTATASVRVESLAPTIVRFDATPNPLVQGAMTELSWEVTGADTITITDDSNNTIYTGAMGTSSVMTQVDQSTVYTLTASNQSPTMSASSVNVITGNQVSISSFTADGQSPNVSIARGASVMLAWDVAHATDVQLDSDQSATPVGAMLVPTGSQMVSPMVTTEYTLTAQGLGGPVERRVTVTVNDP